MSGPASERNEGETPESALSDGGGPRPQSVRSHHADWAKFERDALLRIARAGGLVVDAGGGGRFTKGMKRFEDVFRDIDYRTLDVSAVTRPDIVGSIESMPFEDCSVDAFICRSVLEHVRSPERAVSEMLRSLKPGGQVLITVPSIYPYHARVGPAGYPDLWRFFGDTLRLLLADFDEVELGHVGGPATAAVHFVPLLNRRGRYLRPIALRVDAMVARRRPLSNASMLLAWARK